AIAYTDGMGGRARLETVARDQHASLTDSFVERAPGRVELLGFRTALFGKARFDAVDERSVSGHVSAGLPTPAVGRLLRLEQREMVPVGISEVRGNPVWRVDGGGVLELQSARGQRGEVCAAIIGAEDMVIAAAFGVSRRARIERVATLDQDELHLLAVGRNGQPARATLLLIILTLFESQHASVEVDGAVLIAHDDRHVGCLLNHHLYSFESVRHRFSRLTAVNTLPTMFGWTSTNML